MILFWKRGAKVPNSCTRLIVSNMIDCGPYGSKNINALMPIFGALCCSFLLFFFTKMHPPPPPPEKKERKKCSSIIYGEFYL